VILVSQDHFPKEVETWLITLLQDGIVLLSFFSVVLTTENPLTLGLLAVFWESLQMASLFSQVKMKLINCILSKNVWVLSPLSRWNCFRRIPDLLAWNSLIQPNLKLLRKDILENCPEKPFPLWRLAWRWSLVRELALLMHYCILILKDLALHRIRKLQLWQKWELSLLNPTLTMGLNSTISSILAR